MLTKVRIEVEEQTVGETVEALAKYEHAIACAEAQRYVEQWPTWYSSENPGAEPEVERNLQSSWEMPSELREYFEEELGTELLEQVIEYDQTIPGWRGRAVFAFRRVDTRHNAFVAISSAPVERSSVSIAHGKFFPGKEV